MLIQRFIDPVVAIQQWQRRVRYNDGVSEPVLPSRQAVLSADTSVEIEDRQIGAWRRLSPAESLRLVSETTRAVNELSLAGIRRRYPHATERECFLRLAAIRLGADTVRRLYPDAVALSDRRGPL
jgi:hypothetical protein